jgi:hypothetical protein
VEPVQHPMANVFVLMALFYKAHQQGLLVFNSISNVLFWRRADLNPRGFIEEIVRH